jgi:hypothetical protein
MQEYIVKDIHSKKKIGFTFGHNIDEATTDAKSVGYKDFYLIVDKKSKYNIEGERLRYKDVLGNIY